jgi:phosphoribosyl 1,2-cyclic phosphate phosphodiesterase
MKILVLGSGTSTGVPLIGCNCEVCTSENPKNKRLRPSILITENDVNCLIDTTPDLRAQALKFNILKIDLVLYTHTHADHLFGIDDLRMFNYIKKGAIPIYASEKDIETITTRFDYIFKKKTQSSKPDLIPNIIIDNKINFKNIDIQSVPVFHGSQLINGYRIKDLAYLTDVSKIPEESFKLLQGIKVLMIDALRYDEHPTHLTVAKAIEISNILKPKFTYLMHMGHKIEYEKLSASLPPNIFPSFDGLTFEI